MTIDDWGTFTEQHGFKEQLFEKFGVELEKTDHHQLSKFQKTGSGKIVAELIRLVGNLPEKMTPMSMHQLKGEHIRKHSFLCEFLFEVLSS